MNGNITTSAFPVVGWLDIRHNGRLLCRFDPDRFLLEFKVRGEDRPVVKDLRAYLPKVEETAVIENDPLDELRF